MVKPSRWGGQIYSNWISVDNVLAMSVKDAEKASKVEESRNVSNMIQLSRHIIRDTQTQPEMEGVSSSLTYMCTM